MADYHYCEEDLSAYLDGELAPADFIKIETHLKHCGKCKEAFSRMQSISTGVREISRPEINPLLATKIINQIQAVQNYGELSVTKLLHSWGLLSLFSLSLVIAIFGPILLGVLFVVAKHLSILTSLLIKISWHTPVSMTNLIIGLIFTAGAIISFYGFGRVYLAMSREELVP